MDEAGRFFRYIIPGITFFVEFLLFFLLMQWEWVWGHKCLLKELFVAGNFNVAFSLLFASGGVGYLLGTIYRSTLELWLSPGYYRNIIQNARDWKHLLIKVYGQDQDNPRLLERRTWIVFTFVLHERLAFSARKTTIIKRAESLNHHVHGAGTTTVGAFIAVAISLLSHYWLQPLMSWGLYWGLGISIVLIHFLVYMHALRFNIGFHELVFARELDEAYHYFGENPITVFVPRDFVV